MKKYIIHGCEECLNLISKNIIKDNINTEIHECCKMNYKEVARTEDIIPDVIPSEFIDEIIEIPEWCPLENV